MSTISIRRKIEEELIRRLPKALLETGVDYHCRKGIREDCECPFCTLKRDNRCWGFKFQEGEDGTAREYFFETKIRPKFREELRKKRELL